MSRVARGAALATALALAAAAVAVVPGPRAVADADAAALVERARSVPDAATFNGIVEVTWRDGGRVRVAQVAARSVSGAFVVGTAGDRVVGAGGLRWAGAGPAPAQVARGPVSAALPAADSAWDLEVVADTRVAGRPAAVVVARDRRGDVRARLAFDREVGQLLRIEVFDRAARLTRSVGFVELTIGAGAGSAPTVPGRASAPVARRDVPDGFVAPATVAPGYRLLGRYQHADGTVELHYSDGLFAISLFEQEAELDWDGLPAGGRAGQVAGVRARTYSTAVGTVLVWTDGPLVLTCVVDGPSEVAASVVERITDRPHTGWLHDAAEFVLAPFGWG